MPKKKIYILLTVSNQEGTAIIERASIAVFNAKGDAAIAVTALNAASPATHHYYVSDRKI